MLVITATPVILSTLFLSATVIAAPSRTRTHCRCTFVTDAPARTNWEPLDQSLPPTPIDICTELGPELENFRHAAPDQYDSYLRQSLPASPSEILRPISTSVLLDAAAHSGFQRSQEDQENEPQPTSRPNQRIVCHSEAEPIFAYQSSCLNFWILELIVFFTILACVAEGVQLGLRWMNQRHNKSWQSPKPIPLRLSGDEKRLLAVPSLDRGGIDAMPSPGAEKKLRVYEAASYCSPQASHWKREFIAYDEDEDDEINRPVM